MCVYVITSFMQARVRMPDDLTSDRRLENRVTFSLVNNYAVLQSLNTIIFVLVQTDFIFQENMSRRNCI